MDGPLENLKHQQPYKYQFSRKKLAHLYNKFSPHLPSFTYLLMILHFFFPILKCSPYFVCGGGINPLITLCNICKVLDTLKTSQFRCASVPRKNILLIFLKFHDIHHLCIMSPSLCHFVMCYSLNEVYRHFTLKSQVKWFIIATKIIIFLLHALIMIQLCKYNSIYKFTISKQTTWLIFWCKTNKSMDE